jgi:hypothetical protein
MKKNCGTYCKTLNIRKVFSQIHRKGDIALQARPYRTA